MRSSRTELWMHCTHHWPRWDDSKFKKVGSRKCVASLRSVSMAKILWRFTSASEGLWTSLIMISIADRQRLEPFDVSSGPVVFLESQIEHSASWMHPSLLRTSFKVPALEQGSQPSSSNNLHWSELASFVNVSLLNCQQFLERRNFWKNSLCDFFETNQV